LAAIMTGVVPYQELGVADPIAKVLNDLNMNWASAIISVGAIAGITSVLLVLIMGQPRILCAMSRDGLKWEKPNLGLVEFEGSRANNLVLRGPHGPGVFQELQRLRHPHFAQVPLILRFEYHSGTPSRVMFS
jgi:hypothetical protein